MKKHIIWVGVVVLSVLCSINEVRSAVRFIIGGAISADVSPPPTGLCDGGRTLQLVEEETVVTAINSTGLVVFKAASAENSFSGVGYGLATDGAATTRIFNYDLASIPATLTGSAIVNLVNDPDVASGLRPNIYDSTRLGGGAFLVAGTQVVTPCTGPSTNCVHFRGYVNTTAAVDVVTGSQTNAVVQVLVSTPDFTSYWISYNRLSDSLNVVEKYNRSLISQGTTTGVSNLIAQSLAADNSFIYRIVLSGGLYRLIRNRVSDFNETDHGAYGATYVEVGTVGNNNLFMATQGTLLRVDTTTMTQTGSITLASPTTFPLIDGFGYDSANNKLYVVSADVLQTLVMRVNPDTFAIEQTLTLGGVLTPQQGGTGFDFIHQRIWQIYGGGTTTLRKVSLCS